MRPFAWGESRLLLLGVGNHRRLGRSQPCLHPVLVHHAGNTLAIFEKSAYYSNGDTCEVSRFTYDVVNDALVNETVRWKGCAHA